MNQFVKIVFISVCYLQAVAAFKLPESTKVEQVEETTLVEHQIRNLVKELMHEQLNAVHPKGFIYVQYPWQSGPQTLWPSATWEEVTALYAGHFFRAEGGGSAGFGQAQIENSPMLSHVNSRLEKATGASERKDVDITPGTTSQRLWTGDDRPGYDGLISTSFTMTGGEIRPKNYAIKIWKKL